MRTQSRLTRATRLIERRRAQRRPAIEWWIHYDPETCRDGIEDTTMAWSALRPDVRRPIADLPADAHRIVIRYESPD